MIGKRTLALSAAIGMMACGTPSYSLDFDTLLRQYLGVPNTAVVTDNQADLKLTINNRQAQLEQEIIAGSRSGHLTPDEERELTAALNQAAFVEGAALADGNLTTAETQNVVDELTKVSAKLNAYLSNTTMTGYAAHRLPGQAAGWNGMFRNYVGTGAGDTQVQNQPAVQALIDSRQAQLESAVETALVQGRIDWRDSQSMKTELQKVANQETAFLADAKLTVNEEHQLITGLNAVESSLNTHIASAHRRGGNAWGNRYNRNFSYRSALSRRIENGARSGKLTAQEAARLRQLESQTRTLEQQLRASSGRLSYSQERQLINRLDRLSNRISRELQDKEIW